VSKCILKVVLKIKKLTKNSRTSKLLLPAFAIMFGVVGVLLLLSSFAATPYISIEAESGTKANGVTSFSDSNASGGSAVLFASTSPPTTAQPGVFRGRITLDGVASADVLVKVVNINHPNWNYDNIIAVLSGPDCGSTGAPHCYVTTTDANGNWEATVSTSIEYMLKVFHPSSCAANAVTAPKYTTSDSGFLDTNGTPFHSTPSQQGSNAYNRYNGTRYMYDMPVHVFPAVAGALQGSLGYNDLDIAYSTRYGTFQTSSGPQSC
jgi:hypothetical protein